ncbi:MAG TPA: hypothetical protein VHN98_00485 [Acidimicrobiales bacterium]|nr:hypothetical protein [Acidimicrobiales bacterium]
MEEIEVAHDVRVFEVAVDGNEVRVDIYGGDDNVCGSVRFTFENASVRRRQVEQLEAWKRRETALTFVADGPTVSLADLGALLQDR